jgi:O-acetyl-ADP-ribose deacetylase (regulator of RNase III)
VNVIVNTTSHDLVLTNGAVSNTLLKVAGNEMQREIASKYPNGLKTETFAITSGHGLQCRQVYHTALNAFNHAKEMECRKVGGSFTSFCYWSILFIFLSHKYF